MPARNAGETVGHGLAAFRQDCAECGLAVASACWRPDGLCLTAVVISRQGQLWSVLKSGLATPGLTFFRPQAPCFYGSDFKGERSSHEALPNVFGDMGVGTAEPAILGDRNPHSVRADVFCFINSVFCSSIWCVHERAGVLGWGPAGRLPWALLERIQT